MQAFDCSYCFQDAYTNPHENVSTEVIDAFLLLTRTEGIIPALESSHAIAEAVKVARKSKKSETIVVTLSGRGDKDIEEVQNYLNKHDKN